MAADPNTEPTTLREAIVYFDNPDNCIHYIVVRRWPGGATCPTCGSTKVGFLANQRRWQCATKHPKRQFSVKVGTIFEDSPIPLEKWLPVVWMVTNCKNGVSSWEIHRAIKVTQKSAWFMLHRVRLCMQEGFFRKLDGTVEVDETFIGGKARNMHKDKKRARGIRAGRPSVSSTDGKMIVMGMLERKGRVRAKVIERADKATLHAEVKANVEPGTNLYSDDYTPYMGLDSEYAHKIVNHAEKYVDGLVHTNGCENFWSLLKRSLGGTYVSVEPYHLFRYIDEQAYRFNNRNMNDAQRFSFVIRQIVGRRITYKQLIGKEDSKEPQTTTAD